MGSELSEVLEVAGGRGRRRAQTCSPQQCNFRSEMVLWTKALYGAVTLTPGKWHQK